jgi:putative ABC transport system ATP-binding protein
MSFLVVEELEKRYDEAHPDQAALGGVSFRVEQGEFVALCGPSGCGKSTLLHIVGAMDRPTSGRVWLNGLRLDTLSLEQLAQVRRRRIGFVFQMYNLLPTLTAQENVSLPIILDGRSLTEADRRAREALADVGLLPLAGSHPSQLSGGEMQRVAIARAIAIEPELIVADEPTGSLDSANGRRVLDLLAHLNETRNLTILMATHADEASAYASRRLDLRDGLFQSALSPVN